MSSLIINGLMTNRLLNPIGHNLGGRPRLSWLASGEGDGLSTKYRVQLSECADFCEIIFDSGYSKVIDSLCYELEFDGLRPRTRYYWRVMCEDAAGSEAISEVAFFETAKLDEPWAAEWITPACELDAHPVVEREFTPTKSVRSARAYVCGLGLYELQLNGAKVGDEYLAPGLCAYDKWLPYQTYELELKQGERYIFSAELGNGWYKGRYGLNRSIDFHYGEDFALIAEIVISYEDGSEELIATDESWRARPGTTTFSSIFDGEWRDDTRPAGEPCAVKTLELGKNRLEARRSPATKAMLELSPVELIRTPAGETVIDMGQNMVGFLQFTVRAPRGSRYHLQFGEVLQGGNFYNDNLRTAKAEFIYVAPGVELDVRQKFTFYGFRYVKLTEWPGDVSLNDFVGIVLYSDMPQTGTILTGNDKVNRLFLNTLWGQRGNYLDVPTDCPQRDERMGWTGDSQVFFGTGAFNMDVSAFFGKYMYDMMKEQQTVGGWVPVVVPKHDVKQLGACAWGDAATIIPWNLYVRYGDVSMLRDQYASMKMWVDALLEHDNLTGVARLWKGSFHYGDWLSLDVEDPIGFRFGGTERTYLASCYYLHSTRLLVKAANVLGRADDAARYGELAGEIRAAILREYLTPSGRLAVTTQTAYILALFMDILPEEHRDKAAYALRMKLKDSDYHLRTGFIGTPYLCRVLSTTGSNDIAYRLLLQEDFPSWLYEVNMGATTIWERWNSILPDGSISDTGMNSLNHYSYGSVVEWMYRDVCGINPVEECPGFRRFTIAPKPDRSLIRASARFLSPVGEIVSEWEYVGDVLKFRFAVPYGAVASLTLPSGEQHELKAGEHTFELACTEHSFGLDTPMSELLECAESKAALNDVMPELMNMMLFDMMAGERSVRDYLVEGFFDQADARLGELERRLGAI